MDIVIGVDIGQKRDPTAICVAEVDLRPRECSQDLDKKSTHFLIRHLERLLLGTPYPEVARRIGKISNDLRQRIGARPVIYLDATGVGQPIEDLLREEDSEAWIRPVYFNYGDRRKVAFAELVTSVLEVRRDADQGARHGPGTIKRVDVGRHRPPDFTCRRLPGFRGWRWCTAAGPCDGPA